MGVVKFYCPKCQQKLSAAIEDVGQAIQCPVCNTFMRVPRPPAPEPPLPADKPNQATPFDNPSIERAKARSVPNWVLYAAGAALLITASAGGLAVYFSSRSVPRPPSETWKNIPPPPPRSLQTPGRLAHGADAPHRSSETAANPIPAASTRDARPLATVVTPRTGATSSAAQAGLSKASATVDLPVEERKKIFAELMEADATAAKAAHERFPDEPMYCLRSGDRFLLSRGIPLLAERPPDGVSGSKNGGAPVRAGTTLEIVDVKPGSTAPWYQVRSAADAGNLAGWIDAVALAGQSRTTPDTQATKRREFQAQQLKDLRNAIGTKHGLTSEQVANIFTEGIENWQSDADSLTRE